MPCFGGLCRSIACSIFSALSLSLCWFFFRMLLEIHRAKKMTGWGMKGGLLLLWGENTGTVLWVADRQYLRSCQQDTLRLGFQELTSYSASTNPQIKLCEQSGHREGEAFVFIWSKADAPKWTWNRKGLGVSKDRLEICLFMSLNSSTGSTIKTVIVQVLCCQQQEQHPFSFKANMAQSYLITDSTPVLAVWCCLGRMLQAPLQQLLWSHIKPKPSAQGCAGRKGRL